MGGQSRVHRHVPGVLRGGGTVHRKAGAIRSGHQPGAGRGHDPVRADQAGGLLLQGPVPAGLPVRSGLRAAAYRSGYPGAGKACGGAGLHLHRTGHCHPDRRAVQGADRRGFQTVRHPYLVADADSGNGHRRGGAGPGIPPLGQCPAADRAAGGGTAGGRYFEPVRGSQHGEDRRPPAARCDRGHLI